MSIVKDTALARLIQRIKGFANDNFVKYSGSQTLSSVQKTQARTNIGAIAQEEAVVISDDQPTDPNVRSWVDTSDETGFLVDASDVFCNVWTVTFLAGQWTQLNNKYYQTVSAAGLDHHFQMMSWIPETATAAEYDAYLYLESLYSTLDGSITCVMLQQPSVNFTIKCKYQTATPQVVFDDLVTTDDVANTLDVTAAGKVLDARQGKILNDVKADKDTDAVSGNLAKFDATGNPVDSGYSANNILGLSFVENGSMLQLFKNGNGVFPKMPRTSGTLHILADGTMQNVGSISMPAGFKLVRIKACYNESQPSIIFLTANPSYEQEGSAFKNGHITTQYLSLTTLTDATTAYIFAKYDNAGANDIIYDYVVLNN